MRKVATVHVWYVESGHFPEYGMRKVITEYSKKFCKNAFVLTQSVKWDMEISQQIAAKTTTILGVKLGPGGYQFMNKPEVKNLLLQPTVPLFMLCKNMICVPFMMNIFAYRTRSC